MSAVARKGMLLVISGPSGVGKGTLAKALLEVDTSFCFSISATTRPPRSNEKPDVDYYFISDEAFDQKIAAEEFLEYATVHNSYRYGTPVAPVLEQLEQGKNVILDIDPQGAGAVIRKMPECVPVFLLPPSFKDLHLRLHHRNTEDEANILRRLNTARKEIEQISMYRYVLVNDEVDHALTILRAIVCAEMHATARFIPQIPD